MKILLIGAKGQLGRDLFRTFDGQGHQIVSVDHATFEVSDVVQVEELVASARPDVVLNTAAFHKVEECEKRPDLSFAVNAIGALNLARACARCRAVLVHFSTDYVFGGEKKIPYEESDIPRPLNVYGASKMAGESLIACNANRYFIVRTCGLYGHAGSSGKGGNFVETMIRKAAEGSTIRVVNDQVLTPTSTADLARAINQLIETKAFGLYHVSCEDACSWYEFAREIFVLQKIQANLVPAETQDFPSSVKRPPYSVLSKNRLHGLGISMPRWRDSLDRYLQSRIEKKQETFQPRVAGSIA
jgi:dTDP-4-dehydrorhamnose reductase